jgi:hypothetical protein
MSQSRFKGGIPSPGATQEEAQSFIAGAPGKTTFPWQNPRVRDDMMRALNIEVTEPVKLKLDWLAYNTKTPKRLMVQAALEAYIKREFDRLGIE